MCVAVAVQVKDVSMRRMKGSNYQLKIVWSNGTYSEVCQCFQDLKATYNDVSFCLSNKLKFAHNYCS